MPYFLFPLFSLDRPADGDASADSPTEAGSANAFGLQRSGRGAQNGTNGTNGAKARPRGSKAPAKRSPAKKRRQSPTQMTTLDVEGETVQVTRKRMKNMYLRVRPTDGAILVTAPFGSTDEAIRAFVHSHRRWIASTRARMQAMIQAEIEAGQLDPGTQPTDPRELFRRKWTPERKREATAYMKAHVPPLLRQWTARVGRRPTSVTYRAMTSRWGSCTPSTGRIRLNLELAYVPERLLEYVIVHELVHLWENGHGAGFQRRMSALMPDWRERRHELNTRWRFI